MAFLPISFIFSYEIVIQRPERKTKPSSKLQPSVDPTPRNSTSALASDSSERLLSPSTRQLQRQIRERMSASRKSVADANSLLLLQAVRAARARSTREQKLRERVMDEESLNVLIRATEKLEARIVGEESLTPASRETLSSWSSFDDVGQDTPCPSPKVRTPSYGTDEAGAWVGSSLHRGFAESMLDISQRREASRIWTQNTSANQDRQASVAELLKHYEELESRGKGADSGSKH